MKQNKWMKAHTNTLISTYQNGRKINIKFNFPEKNLNPDYLFFVHKNQNSNF